ncbi:MAG: hypothetical protein ACKV2V_22135 [Blastocatellia bacterium]
MNALEITVTLPDSLAREAEASGLLDPGAIEMLLRQEIRRRRIDRFFNAANRLADAGPAPMSEAEIEAEIVAIRCVSEAEGRNPGRLRYHGRRSW